MRCHYVYEKDGRFLIPGCWPVVMSDNMRDCSCNEHNLTFKQFEKQEYNNAIKEKDRQIKELEKELFRLNRILKRIYEGQGQ